MVRWPHSWGAALLSAALLAGAGVVQAADADTEPAFQVSRFSWKEDPGAPVQLIVHNRFGNVRCRSWPADELSITGQLQHAPDAPPLKVNVERQRQTIRVTVRKPESDAVDTLHRADLVVLAPRGLGISVYTDTGDIRFKKYHGAITAHSRAGDIRLRATGSIEAISETGSISARPGNRLGGFVSLQTGSGAIDVRVPDTANVKVEARTAQGRVLSDFEMEALGESGEGVAVTVGAGDEVLQARSRSGIIRVNRATEGIREW